MKTKIKIANCMNDKVLTVGNNGVVIVENDKPSATQYFSIGNNFSSLVIQWDITDKVLDMENQSKAIYAKAIVYKYHGKMNQQWSLQKMNEPYYYIENVQSKKVLQIEGGIDAEGMNVVQNVPRNNKNQLWKIVTV